MKDDFEERAKVKKKTHGINFLRAVFKNSSMGVSVEYLAMRCKILKYNKKMLISKIE